MGKSRMDELAMTAASGSRRALIKASIGAAFGGALGLTGLRSTSAARKRADGAVCRANSDCQSNFCAITDCKHNRGICSSECKYSFNGCEPI